MIVSVYPSLPKVLKLGKNLNILAIYYPIQDGYMLVTWRLNWVHDSTYSLPNWPCVAYPIYK